ncbi:hypothetical protein GCM10011499_29490 [Pelagibacterium lentulum]|uniref:Uncharacterized protein n=1 Tax=Pelagibacterium lentulum TaxID=2029865 RepID=A0A916RIP2_9HYPH|nr:hypothetical protein GCM10011499_29490 [Pelagibacterium lentulum]
MVPAIGFELSPNKLWLDEAPGMSQAEIWLERSLIATAIPTHNRHKELQP